MTSAPITCTIAYLKTQSTRKYGETAIKFMWRTQLDQFLQIGRFPQLGRFPQPGRKSYVVFINGLIYPAAVLKIICYSTNGPMLRRRSQSQWRVVTFPELHVIHRSKKEHLPGIEAFKSTSRYLDDLLNIDNPYFEGMVNRIYPP